MDVSIDESFLIRSHNFLINILWRGFYRYHTYLLREVREANLQSAVIHYILVMWTCFRYKVFGKLLLWLEMVIIEISMAWILLAGNYSFSGNGVPRQGFCCGFVLELQWNV